MGEAAKSAKAVPVTGFGSNWERRSMYARKIRYLSVKVFVFLHLREIDMAPSW
jgi:hypothetical protein